MVIHSGASAAFMLTWQTYSRTPSGIRWLWSHSRGHVVLKARCDGAVAVAVAAAWWCWHGNGDVAGLAVVVVRIGCAVARTHLGGRVAFFVLPSFKARGWDAFKWGYTLVWVAPVGTLLLMLRSTDSVRGASKLALLYAG